VSAKGDVSVDMAMVGVEYGVEYGISDTGIR